MRYTVIAMDGQGNVDFRDEQEFASEEVAKRVADGLNVDAERSGSDWFYMPSPPVQDTLAPSRAVSYRTGWDVI